VRACQNFFIGTDPAAKDPSRTILFVGPTWGHLGTVVNAAGDVNGDGFGDFALAAPGSLGSSSVNSVYLVFGRAAQDWTAAAMTQRGFNFEVFADTPNASSWLVIKNSVSSEHFGEHGIAHGDFNADGFSDIAISSNDNQVYVVYGHNGSWASFDVTDIGTDIQMGFHISGSLSTPAMFVGNAGDMNGDGIEDILVTACSSDTECYNPASACVPYIVFGKRGAVRDNFDLISINCINGFKLVGGSSCFGAPWTAQGM